MQTLHTSLLFFQLLLIPSPLPPPLPLFFLTDLQDVGTRNRVLSALAQTLNDVAHEHSVAMVVTNHITTRIDRGGTTSGGGGGGAISR